MNNMLLSPCKDCPERRFDCHTKCEKYKDFIAVRQKIRAGRDKENDIYDAFAAIRKAGNAPRKK